MGVDISAKLMYGLPYNEFPDHVQESFEDEIDLEEFDHASPWYDSSRNDWIIGYEVIDECGIAEFTERAATAKHRFIHKFGFDGRFIVTPDVT